MKIGVLADTHVPDILPALPPSVFEVFQGVDIILHAGDVCHLSVLQKLEPLAQTFAVFGDQDGAQVKRFLQEKQQLEFMNRSVGLIHGQHAWEGNLLTRTIYRVDAAKREHALYESVLRAFPGVDVIVFGHSHTPYIKMHDSVLLFNPGSVVPHGGEPGTVGMLEITTNTIKGRIISL